jgi:hypothetical protein
MCPRIYTFTPCCFALVYYYSVRAIQNIEVERQRGTQGERKRKKRERGKRITNSVLKN